MCSSNHEKGVKHFHLVSGDKDEIRKWQQDFEEQKQRNKQLQKRNLRFRQIRNFLFLGGYHRPVWPVRHALCQSLESTQYTL